MTNEISIVGGTPPNYATSSTPTFMVASDGGAAQYFAKLDGFDLGFFQDDGSGSRTYIPAGELADGDHILEVEELSPNPANLPPFAFKVDTQKPDAPGTPQFPAYYRLTDNTVPANYGWPHVAGSCSADTQNVLVFEGARLVGGAGVFGTGKYDAALRLFAGAHTVTAVAVDKAGNRSVASSAFTFTKATA